GFSTVDFAQAEARYTRYNWLGGARQLDLRGAVSNLLAPQLNGSFIFKDVTPASLGGTREDAFLRPNWQVSADLVQPWFRSTKNSLGTSVFAHRRSAPGIFIDRGYGAGASFTRRLGERAPLTASYRFEVTEVEAGDVYFCVNYGVCDRGTIEVLGKRQRLSPLALSFFVDRTNDVVDATSGYSWRADAEHASTYTGSTFRYHRAYGETARYFTIRGNMVLAGRVRAGWVKSIGRGGSVSDVVPTAGEDILHPRKRFYAGGSQSVRGYGENQLGPRILTVDPNALIANGCTEATIANGGCDPNPTPTDAFQPQPLGSESLLESSVELRFPLWKMLRGAVFVDAAVLGHESPGGIPNRTGAVTPGFGVRFGTPLGPIRVDLGVRPRIVEDLPVVTQVADTAGGSGTKRIVRLRDASGEPVTKRYDPVGGSSGTFRRTLDRLTLHFSIGHAF
ncbi:MAG: BamA/TamA family outer membrane protein, partial [Gemmatimonadaceae bacterium]